MPDFDVNITVTVCGVASANEAVAVVQGILQKFQRPGAKTTFVPVPADVVESETR